MSEKDYYEQVEEKTYDVSLSEYIILRNLEFRTHFTMESLSNVASIPQRIIKPALKKMLSKELIHKDDKDCYFISASGSEVLGLYRIKIGIAQL